MQIVIKVSFHCSVFSTRVHYQMKSHSQQSQSFTISPDEEMLTFRMSTGQSWTQWRKHPSSQWKESFDSSTGWKSSVQHNEQLTNMRITVERRQSVWRVCQVFVDFLIHVQWSSVALSSIADNPAKKSTGWSWVEVPVRTAMTDDDWQSSLVGLEANDETSLFNMSVSCERS